MWHWKCFRPLSSRKNGKDKGKWIWLSSHFMSNWFLIIIEAIQIASRSLVCKFLLETQQTECQVRNTVKNSSGRLSIVIRKTDFRMLGFKSAKRDIWQWKSSVKWSKKGTERRRWKAFKGILRLEFLRSFKFWPETLSESIGDCRWVIDQWKWYLLIKWRRSSFKSDEFNEFSKISEFPVVEWKNRWPAAEVCSQLVNFTNKNEGDFHFHCELPFVTESCD